MLGSLLGSFANVVSASSSAGATPSDSPPSPSSPSSAPTPDSTQSSAPATAPTNSADPASDADADPFLRSAYFQRLLKRGGHHPNRIQAIKDAALRDEPPREPGPWECCGGGCALECVVTMWWEEEKTWRDMHPDWKSIRQRLKEEEEDRQREAEEEAALNGGDGDNGDAKDEVDGAQDRTGSRAGAPKVEIGVEDEEQPAIETVEQGLDKLAF